MGGCELQVRTWWVCLATAPRSSSISGVVNHAISCPGFLRRFWALFAPCCAASDRTPRPPAPRLGRIHCLQRWLGERISPSLYVGIRRLPARATGSARSRHIRDARGHPMAAQGGQGTQLQDSGALVHEQASTRSGAGLRSQKPVLHFGRNRYRVRVILLTPQSQPPQGPTISKCGPAPRPRELFPRRPSAWPK